jgi:hypothetical protein
MVDGFWSEQVAAGGERDNKNSNRMVARGLYYQSLVAKKEREIRRQEKWEQDTATQQQHEREQEEWEREPHRLQLACMNCVSCCDPVPVSDLVRERRREQWALEEEAHVKALRESQEKYTCKVLKGRDVFSNTARSYNNKLSILLPMIVMKGDGSMAQYDMPEPTPQPHQRQEKPKVSLNSLYRESTDSVSFHQAARDKKKRTKKNSKTSDLKKVSSSQDLVEMLGLLQVSCSDLRGRRGLRPLQSLLLPLKMTNISITARVEEMGFEDYVKVQRCNYHDDQNAYLQPPRSPLELAPLRKTTGNKGSTSDLLSDEFNSEDSSNCSLSQAAEELLLGEQNLNEKSLGKQSSRKTNKKSKKKNHWRCWSWDSGFGSSSFKDLTSTMTPDVSPLVGDKENENRNTISTQQQQQGQWTFVGSQQKKKKEEDTLAASHLLQSWKANANAPSSITNSLMNVCSYVNNGICHTIRKSLHIA